jgi:flagellar basal-body rod modification protein FlgD
MSNTITTTGLLNASVIGAAQTAAKPKTDMGKDDFLKLLVGQLQNQDPMNPMEDKDFMGQMAQFSQLEQMTNVAATLQSERAFSMLGRDVVYNDDKTGELVTGKVEKVAIDGATTTLTVAGVSGIKTEAVKEVR